jgi:hypothetical protein
LRLQGADELRAGERHGDQVVAERLRRVDVAISDRAIRAARLDGRPKAARIGDRHFHTMLPHGLEMRVRDEIAEVAFRPPAKWPA